MCRVVQREIVSCAYNIPISSWKKIFSTLEWQLIITMSSSIAYQLRFPISRKYSIIEYRRAREKMVLGMNGWRVPGGEIKQTETVSAGQRSHVREHRRTSICNYCAFLDRSVLAYVLLIEWNSEPELLNHDIPPILGVPLRYIS